MIRELIRMRASGRTGIPSWIAACGTIAVLACFAAVAVAAVAPFAALSAFAAEAREEAEVVGPAVPVKPPSPAEAPAAAPPTKPRALPTTWHATVFFSGSSQYRIIHYWSAGSSMRAETLINGHPVTTIVRGDRYVVIDRMAGKALDVERAPQAVKDDKGRLRPFGIELDEIRKAGAEKVEETKLSGVPVEVWRITDKTSRRTVWVTKASPRVPLRVETFVRGSSETLTFDYSNWSFDLAMPDAFFEIPSDIDVEELDYDEYEEKSAKGAVGPGPILYPDLLHGGRP